MADEGGTSTTHVPRWWHVRQYDVKDGTPARSVGFSAAVRNGFIQAGWIMCSQSPAIQRAIRDGDIFRDPSFEKNNDIDAHMCQELEKHGYSAGPGSFSSTIRGWKIFYNMRKGDKVVMYHVYNKRADGECLDDEAEMAVPSSVGALDPMWMHMNSPHNAIMAEDTDMLRHVGEPGITAQEYNEGKRLYQWTKEEFDKRELPVRWTHVGDYEKLTRANGNSKVIYFFGQATFSQLSNKKQFNSGVVMPDGMTPAEELMRHAREFRPGELADLADLSEPYAPLALPAAAPVAAAPVLVPTPPPVAAHHKAKKTTARDQCESRGTPRRGAADMAMKEMKKLKDYDDATAAAAADDAFEAKMSPSPFMGRRVLGLFDDCQKWFLGVVAEFDSNRRETPYLIRYDDGDEEWVGLPDATIHFPSAAEVARAERREESEGWWEKSELSPVSERGDAPNARGEDEEEDGHTRPPRKENQKAIEDGGRGARVTERAPASSSPTTPTTPVPPRHPPP